MREGAEYKYQGGRETETETYSQRKTEKQENRQREREKERERAFLLKAKKECHVSLKFNI